MYLYEIYAAVICMLIVACWLLVRWWRGVEAEWQRQGDKWREYEAQINQLPFEEVRERAEVLLKNLDSSEYVEAQLDQTGNTQHLPPLLRDLFSRYESFFYADYSFSRDEIKAYPWDTAFVMIGEESEARLLVKPPDESIYLLMEGMSAEELTQEESYPTIYHWILMHDPASDDL